MWIDVYSNNFSRTSFDFSFVDKDSMKSEAIASNAWFIAYLYQLKIIEWEKTESACKFSLSLSTTRTHLQVSMMILLLI